MYAFFQTYDVDKDGNLNAAELRKLLDNSKDGKRFKDPRKGIRANDQFCSFYWACWPVKFRKRTGHNGVVTCSKIIQRLDEDGDKKLNFGEFVRLVSKAHLTHEGQVLGFDPEPYKKLFAAYGGEPGDKGSLKAGDIRKVAEALGRAISRSEAKEAVKKHDYDKDKKLVFQASFGPIFDLFCCGYPGTQ